MTSAIFLFLLKGNDKLNKTGFECPADGFYPVGECDPFYYVCLGGTVYPAVSIRITLR